jgi:hypothetical protein
LFHFNILSFLLLFSTTYVQGPMLPGSMSFISPGSQPTQYGRHILTGTTHLSLKSHELTWIQAANGGKRRHDLPIEPISMLL